MNVAKRIIPRPIKQKIKNYQAKIKNYQASYRRKVRLFGDLAPLVPPVECMFDGPQSLEEFKSNGEEFLKIYKGICGLQPDEKMLDVGSGIGRKTLPLTQYFNQQAQYEGIDVAKAGVDWCREKITPKYPNFHFQQIDVYNKLYNPSGSTPSSAYRFPFADESFTFVMLGSVFTHMLPEDVVHYLSEIYRVLEKERRCLISYFLLNEESLRLVKAGKSTLDFKYPFEGYMVVAEDMPEAAIAYDQNWITHLYNKMGLEIKRIDYGSWCGRERYLSYQDLILAVKR